MNWSHPVISIRYTPIYSNFYPSKPMRYPYRAIGQIIHFIPGCLLLIILCLFCCLIDSFILIKRRLFDGRFLECRWSLWGLLRNLKPKCAFGFVYHFWQKGSFSTMPECILLYWWCTLLPKCIFLLYNP